jgi:peptidoglycan/xylan/chitin deacetylase (PgdA/CDA1 family)
MLNFRLVNIIFCILLLISIGLNLFFTIPWYIYALLFLAWISLLFYGSYFINSQFYLEAICRIETNQKIIALTFDDGPDHSATESLLTTLSEEKVEAAFFCIGRNIAGQESLLQKMHASGHLIGNHSFSHSAWFDFLSSKKMLNDLQAMDQITIRTIGLKPLFFRPPYGVTNPNLSKAVREGNYVAVGWSVRSLDTVIRDKKKLFRKVSRVRPGDIILFHDRSEAMHTILPELIRSLKSRGFQIIRLDKLLNLEPYA